MVFVLLLPLPLLQVVLVETQKNISSFVFDDPTMGRTLSIDGSRVGVGIIRHTHDFRKSRSKAVPTAQTV